jgi:hypothetical protein
MTAIMIGALLKPGIPVTLRGADSGRLADEILRVGGMQSMQASRLKVRGKGVEKPFFLIMPSRRPRTVTSSLQAFFVARSRQRVCLDRGAPGG